MVTFVEPTQPNTDAVQLGLGAEPVYPDAFDDTDASGYPCTRRFEYM